MCDQAKQNAISAQVKQMCESIMSELRARNECLGVAESLTGGLLAATFVSIPGISAVFNGGVVSYTNDVKSRILGVDSLLLATGGAVQASVAMQMATGVGKLLNANYALATTGVAGPGPADGKEAGTVFIGLKTLDGVKAHEYHFAGERAQVRQESVEKAISLLYRELFLHERNDFNNFE